MNAYDFDVKTSEGDEISLSQYRGKITLIVNTASKCGFTPQYQDLEKLYEAYKDEGFTILAFPCNQFKQQEPDSDPAIRAFCTNTYGVTFPVMAKIDVGGENALPLFRYLVAQTKFRGFDSGHPLSEKLDQILSEEDPGYQDNDGIKWNFTKFLIARDGQVAARFEPTAPLADIEKTIRELL